MWVREKASLTGRRWRSIVLGRKSMKSFLHTEVPPKPSPEPSTTAILPALALDVVHDRLKDINAAL